MVIRLKIVLVIPITPNIVFNPNNVRCNGTDTQPNGNRWIMVYYHFLDLILNSFESPREPLIFTGKQDWFLDFFLKLIFYKNHFKIKLYPSQRKDSPVNKLTSNFVFSLKMRKDSENLCPKKWGNFKKLWSQHSYTSVDWINVRPLFSSCAMHFNYYYIFQPIYLKY